MNPGCTETFLEAFSHSCRNTEARPTPGAQHHPRCGSARRPHGTPSHFQQGCSVPKVTQLGQGRTDCPGSFRVAKVTNIMSRSNCVLKVTVSPWSHSMSWTAELKLSPTLLSLSPHRYVSQVRAL